MRKILTIVLVLLSASIAEAEPPGKYPDPALTPGVVLTTDATVTCQGGYAIDLRKREGPTQKEKCAVFAAYGLPCKNKRGEFQVDHFLPMKLGGSPNGLKNLWPQRWSWWKKKDLTEFSAIHAVCVEHSMTLPDAQAALMEDWYALYLKFKKESRLRDYDVNERKKHQRSSTHKVETK